MENFKQIGQKTPQLLHFHFLMPCRIAFVTSYLSENEAENLQNGDVHLAQIPDVGMEYLEPFGALRSVSDGLFFALFMLFHLSLTFSFLTRVSL